MAIPEQIAHFNTLGHVIAVDVDEDIFMLDYAAHFCEWVNGTVIKMSPVHDKHDSLTRYLAHLLDAYFELNPIGQLRLQPFVMRLQIGTKRSNREPDLQIILDTNSNALTPTYMDGAADIAIEIVSRESKDRDYGEKFHEYEQANVREYWLIDPLQQQIRFYRLGKLGAYVLQDTDKHYQTPLLPKLKMPIATLWKSKLPGPIAIGQQVQAMLT